MAKTKRPKGKRGPKGPKPPHLLNSIGVWGGSSHTSLAASNGNASSTSLAYNSKTGNAYSLAEEARNTAHKRRAFWGQDAKLRLQPVNFVSAGLMDPSRDLNIKLEGSSEYSPSQSSKAATSPHAGATQVEASSETQLSRASELTNIPEARPVSPTEEYLPSHTAGEELLQTHEAVPLGVNTNNDKDAESDSSEEVLLFMGRDAARSGNICTEVSAKAPRKSTSPQPHPQTIMPGAQADDITIRHIGCLNFTEDVAEVELQENAAFSSSFRLKSRGSRRTHRKQKVDDETAALIADYIANMDDEDDEDVEEAGAQHTGLGFGTHPFQAMCDLGGTDSDAVPDECSVGDSSLDHQNSIGALDSDDGEGPENDDDEDEETRKRRIEKEDERMARILAKQEELGLGMDETLLLFDGADYEDLDLDPSILTPRRKKKGSAKKLVGKKGQYPSATAMADAFDDLDLMDWNRPSLRKATGRRAQQQFDNYDSDLEHAMNVAWQKDRLKKAERKRLREDLRSQGLLGRDVDPGDLRVKYQGGMTIDDLANELEDFLKGSAAQLAFPPLDKNARLIIHQLATKFKLKSKSAGGGTDRYPVLYRTKTTVRYSEQILDNAIARIKRPWFPRVDIDATEAKQFRLTRRTEMTRDRDRGHRTVTYREGEVVGRNASEIGSENKGRAMLEKMGWTKGMALGMETNRGILVPIEHVVKKTKAGLGDA